MTPILLTPATVGIPWPAVRPVFGGEEFAEVHVSGVRHDQAQVEVVGGGDEGVQEVRFGQVDSDGPVLDAMLAGQVAADLVQHRQSSSGEDEIDAVGRQLGGERAADAGGRPGDQSPGPEAVLVDRGDSGSHDAPSGLRRGGRAAVGV